MTWINPLLMLLRASPGTEGDKGAYYYKINILLEGNFNAVPSSCFPEANICIKQESWALEEGTRLFLQGVTLGSGEEPVRAPGQQALSL